VLEWGRTHNLEPFASELNGRLSLVQGDATLTESPPVDIVCAFNFSFCVFKKRAELLRYFQRAYASLAPGGLFFLDIYGGTEAIVELKEDRSVEKFTYIWEQSKFNPLTHETTCHIHFKFKDGSRLSPAFTYEWRLWTVPELREVLEEAGFADSRIYWEEMEASDDDDEDEMLEGSGVFAPATEVENQESWVCYVVGLKDKL
jgi:SAM-dependent methyltransferase